MKKKYKINKGFIVQKLDDKTVIFDGEESVLYTFNETASFIFKQIKADFCTDQIVEHMIKRYGIEKKQAFQDILTLIDELKKKKVII